MDATEEARMVRENARKRLFVCAGAAAVALAAANVSLAQVIDYTPPADAPGGGAGSVGILEVTGNGGIGNQDQARASLSGGAGTRVLNSLPFVDILNTGTDGHFRNNNNFVSENNAGGPPVNEVNDIALNIRGIMRITTPGVYTFGVASDDGFTLAINNGATTWSNAVTNGGDAAAQQGPYLTNTPTYNGNVNGALHFYGGRGTADTLGQVTLPAGDHPFNLTFHEGGGGASVEFFAAQGAKTAFDTDFNLVGGPQVTRPARPSKVNGVGQWTLREYNAAGNLDNILATARGTGGTATLRATNTVPSVRYVDPSGANAGTHGGDAAPFPGDMPGDDNDYGAFASAPLTISAADAGRKTFLMYSDDESAMRILNSSGVPVQLAGVAGTGTTEQRDTNADGLNDEFGKFGGCCTDYLGKYDLAAGNYTIEAAFKEGGGGSGFFIYGANGDHDSFNTNDFELLGGLPAGPTTPAGIQLVPEPGVTSLFALAGLGLIARRRRRA